MSFADFTNFGSAALNMAGEVAIIGETGKMLRGAQRSVGGGPHKCRHCGSLHPTRAALSAHYKYEHPPKRETGIDGSYASHKDDFEFDFRL